MTSFPPDGPMPSRSSISRRIQPRPLGREAYVGVLGEFLDLVAPESEADPAAILAHALVYTGSSIGRGVHFNVDGCRHGCATNALVVGATAQGRKGTSEAWPRRLLKIADPQWAKHCLASGLSSGEGLVNHVRDPVQIGVDRESGEPVMDAGVLDKRASVLESEFGRTLRVLRRDGNTLSQVMRQAWDGQDLRVMTKSQVCSTGPHVSIVGHVVKHELLTRLDDSDVHGGTMNRFLFFAVERQQELPFGGNVDEGRLALIGQRLGRHLANVQGKDCMFELTESARAVWPEIYAALSRGASAPGLAGVLLGRGVPHVRRLAMVYAVSDGASAVDASHLWAAVEVWRYSMESVRLVFGDRTGNPLADRIEDMLREASDLRLTRSELREKLGGRVLGDRIDEALELLIECDRVRIERDRGTGGRPSEVCILL